MVIVNDYVIQFRGGHFTPKILSVVISKIQIKPLISKIIFFVLGRLKSGTMYLD